MAKRVSALVAKPGEIRVGWARPDRGEPPEVCVAWGGGGAHKSEGWIVLEALQGCDVFEGRDLVTELDRRGYDISTLKFSIRLKAETEGPAK